MWEQFVIPMLTMVIGLIAGATAVDAFKTDRRIEKIEREMKRMKKRMEGLE